VPKITIAQNILAANDTIAQDIQQLLTSREIRTINLMSSPGAGKTTLLERTIELLRGKLDVGVIEGDIETGTDAERIEAAGAETKFVVPYAPRVSPVRGRYPRIKSAAELRFLPSSCTSRSSIAVPLPQPTKRRSPSVFSSDIGRARLSAAAFHICRFFPRNFE